MFHIGYVLAETVIFRVFNGQDTEQFPLQFGDQILIFDDVVLVVATDMDSSMYLSVMGMASLIKKMDCEEVRPM